MAHLTRRMFRIQPNNAHRAYYNHHMSSQLLYIRYHSFVITSHVLHIAYSYCILYIHVPLLVMIRHMYTMVLSNDSNNTIHMNSSISINVTITIAIIISRYVTRTLVSTTHSNVTMMLRLHILLISQVHVLVSMCLMAL